MALILPSYDNSNYYYNDEPMALSAFGPVRTHSFLSPFSAPRRHLRRFNPMGLFRVLDDFEGPDDVGLRLTRKDDRLEAKLDMTGFEPNDLKVHVDPKTRMLSVEAQKEDRSDEDGVSYRKIHRTVRLPDECKLDTLKSFLKKDGVLQLTCDLDKSKAVVANKSPQPREIKINFTGQPLKITNQKPKEVVKNIPIMTSNDDRDQQASGDRVEDDGSSGKDVAVSSSNVADKQPEDFRVRVNMSGFTPEDLVIEASEDGHVTVVGKHREELEDGGEVSREMKRKVIVDASKYDLDVLETNLDNDGYLTITAPAKKS